MKGSSHMDKSYIIESIQERIEVLRARHIDATLNTKKLSYGSAAVARNKIKTDLNLCKLLEELFTQLPGNELMLSEDAYDALDKLIEPIERHRHVCV
jgi:hypothetical protein